MQYMLFTKKNAIFKMLLTLMAGCALCFSAQTLAAPATSATYNEEGPASAQQDLNSIMSAPEIGYLGVLSTRPYLPQGLMIPRGLMTVCLIFIILMQL